LRAAGNGKLPETCFDCSELPRRLVPVLERARIGLREMPSNAAWLASRAFKALRAGGESGAPAPARTGGHDRRRKAAAIVDPAGDGGFSVDMLVRRAREAAERAQTAEDQALEAAEESRALAERAREVSERGRALMEEVNRETSLEVEERVAQASRTAEKLVKDERRAAEAVAEEERRAVREEVDAELEEAEREAEASQERAHDLVQDAAEALAQARRLADEAVAAARAVSDEAARQAQELAAEAELASIDIELRARARELGGEPTHAGLKSFHKPELVELAASVGVETRASMTKEELVDAITRASR
jgi:colicin import membrane protein